MSNKVQKDKESKAVKAKIRKMTILYSTNLGFKAIFSHETRRNITWAWLKNLQS